VQTDFREVICLLYRMKLINNVPVGGLLITIAKYINAGQSYWSWAMAARAVISTIFDRYL
jgi:hypothetical protein